MTDETLVSAEVLLRESDRAAGERVAKMLTELGLEVLSVGSRSVSIRGSKQRFESVFGCRLTPSERVDSPARDFGPLGGGGFRAIEPPKVPSELRDEVESVEIQQPPLLF
ncbi:MAG: hypothetical protein M3Q62_04535 [Actinomycetota bacterium]|jgi:hypothetical protein|nr:hypothetical protein [Rubrobacteraceae bacterium]MBA3636038.1 hypothetical protein [Rubrobacteraceae bacterium]MDQ3182804.1 hypothetical protein [Actinomycetota bacterium]MDQ3498713.1 hypothetical protein [Actinomycetota bacterium]